MLPVKRFTEIQGSQIRLYDGALDIAPEYVSRETYVSEISLDQYKAALDRHDWYYMMSDDSRYFNSGMLWGSLLIEIADSRDDWFKQAYNLAHQEVFDKSHFAGTYVYPYPEVAERMAKLFD